MVHHGRVVDGFGRPVAIAQVVIIASTVPMPEIALQCDQKGNFSLSLPPGCFTLRAHGPAGMVGDINVEIPQNETDIIIAIHE